MKLSVMLSTVQNLGDHGERVKLAVEYIEGETVEDLVERVAERHGGYVFKGKKPLDPADVIEIRVIERNVEADF